MPASANYSMSKHYNIRESVRNRAQHMKYNHEPAPLFEKRKTPTQALRINLEYRPRRTITFVDDLQQKQGRRYTYTTK